MSRTTKILLIVGSLTAVGVIAFFLVRSLRNPTRDQFSSIKSESDKLGYDIFEFSSPDQMEKAFVFFQKNLTRQEAEKMLDLMKRSKDDKSAETEMIMLFNKMMKGFKN